MSSKQYWLIVLAICVFAFASRIYRLGEIKSYTFDEVYHAVTAKLIARNDPQAFEWWNPPIEPDTAVDWLHPPLAKYTQAFAMRIFGETPFGWRISAAVFGTLLIVVVAEFSRALFNDRRLALLAAFLASLDGLLLTQSRIAMNDIHVTVALLLTFWSYLWFRRTQQKYIDLSPAARLKTSGEKLRRASRFALLVTGLCIGLALGSKWSGFFGFLTVWGFEVLFLISQLHQLAPKPWQASRDVLARVLFIGLLPFVVYVLSYTHMFLQGKTLICEGNVPQNGSCYCNQNSSTWVTVMQKIAGGDGSSWEKLEARGGCKRLISHFSELHHQIWWYQTNLEATHGYQSRPFQWFFNLKPVWFYVKYDEGTVANIYAQGNPSLFWFGDIAIFATVILVVLQGIRSLYTSMKGSKTVRQAFAGFQNSVTQFTDFATEKSQLFYIIVAYFAVWLPWQASPRIMFFYHYTPAVPLLAILLSYWLIKLSKEKTGRPIAIAVVAITVLVFVLFYPNWTGIAVPQWYAEALYFRIPSWK